MAGASINGYDPLADPRVLRRLERCRAAGCPAAFRFQKRAGRYVKRDGERMPLLCGFLPALLACPRLGRDEEDRGGDGDLPADEAGAPVQLALAMT